ncbi:hypothetical protein [Rhizobium leguminosarum]|uniref:Uncharacterized protein n=1 Tax=Rhizobium leguminosarum TaxID=384 RepID=A0A7M3DQI4_RHILE|nr:hypothetical protein [Rhizobium leguminosarum]TAY50938.1 hypothetical protein ELH90_04055 [Rhizobium leguminosarum]
MKTGQNAVLTLLLLSTSLHAQDASSPDQCSSEQSAMNSIKEKYEPRFQQLQQEGEALKDSDDAKMLKVDLKWADTEIVFGTPSVTIKDTKMSFGVPQVTMKESEITFGTPSVRMVRKKTGQYPETRCEDTWIKIGPVKTKGVPKCTVTWSDIFIDVPEPFLEQQHIKLSIPEFTFADTSIVVGIPQFFMQQQKIVIGVPQVTVHSVLDSKPLKDKAEALSNKVAEAKAAEVKDITEVVHALYSCYRAMLAKQRLEAENQFNVSLAQMDGFIQSLRAQGADPTKLAGQDGETNLVAKREELARQREQALAQFDASLQQLDQSEKDAVEKMQS